MRKYISIILSVLILSTLLVGCGNTNHPAETPIKIENQIEILETDSETVKIAKLAHNELQRYATGDIVIVNMSKATSVSTEDFSPVEDYTDAVIIKDKNRELYNETGMDYICIYTPDGNYIFTSGNEVIDADATLSNFTTGTFNNNSKLVSWLINNPDKFEYTKNIGEDNTISYSFKTTDTAFVKEKYYATFGMMEFLEFLDGHYEFVLTFNVDNQLTQIDWFGTSTDETMAIETASTFSTDLAEGYNMLGEGIDGIWDLLP